MPWPESKTLRRENRRNMFQTLQNTAKIDVRIVPDGPILVRAQSVGLDPGVADMEFQRTHRNGQSTVFLAGSGLKGVLRSHAERLLRSAGHFSCDPTLTRDRTTCGRRDLGDSSESYPHNGQCPACFTFGSLKLAGRFRIGDAYPPDDLFDATNRTEVRTGVGIERKSQASASSHGVLYDAEVVVSGAFDARIQAENYSLWQLGLMLAALQDLCNGLIRIGGCKARGMGTVRLERWRVDLGFLNQDSGQITGARPQGSGGNPYSLPARDSLAAPAGGQPGRQGLFRLLTYEGDHVGRLTDTLVAGPLQRYLDRRS
ncbi:MAG TPA: RAMP superfamily CRISPR-associated protein [Thermoanaerobaculia bacterium]|nr:RAMP superfamily CRISPR-associated protein [Thermoanaerobaculia bacterium]